MTAHEITLLIGFFGTVMAGIVAAGYMFVLRPQLAPPRSELTGGEPEAKSIRGVLTRAFRLIGEAVPAPGNRAEPVRKRLIAAGYRWPSAISIFNGITLATASLFGLLAAWAAFLYQPDLFAILLAGACGAGFGYLLPTRVLGWQVKERRVRLRQALPVGLDLMVLSVEAGQAIDATLAETAREMRSIFPDLAAEFAAMVSELRSGRSRLEVFQDFAKRNGEAELKKVATLLIDSDRFGTSLGPSLRLHARYLRIRRRQQAQEQARKVGVKLVFPIFFLIFPCVLLVTLGPAILHIFTTLEPMLGP